MRTRCARHIEMRGSAKEHVHALAGNPLQKRNVRIFSLCVPAWVRCVEPDGCINRAKR